MKRLTVTLLVFSAFTPAIFGQTVEQKEPTVFSSRVEINRGTERDHENVITPTAGYAQTVGEEEPTALFSCVEIIRGTQRQCENVPQPTVSAQTPVSGSVRGERDARKNLASGHYVQLGYGLPSFSPPYSEFVQCLQGYGIEVRDIGGDVFFGPDEIDRSTGLELSYYQSYNATSAATAMHKFGFDVFDRCRNTARKKWETRHPESQP